METDKKRDKGGKEMLNGRIKGNDGFIDYETPVGYETAKKLSESGIEWSKNLSKHFGYHYYNCHGELDGNCMDEIKAVISGENDKSKTSINAPTYGQILSHFHRNGIFISIMPEVYDNGVNWLWKVTYLNNDEHSTGLCGDNNEYSEFNLAADAAINYVVKNLMSNLSF